MHKPLQCWLERQQSTFYCVPARKKEEKAIQLTAFPEGRPFLKLPAWVGGITWKWRAKNNANTDQFQHYEKKKNEEHLEKQREKQERKQ